MRGQHLVIDADDTLWENNIYFEAAFDSFCQLVNHSQLTATELRAVLDEIEIANIKLHGYGAMNFARNLRDCLPKVAEWPVEDRHLAEAGQLALEILNQPVDLIAGVRETLEYLQTRHELVLFTKGDPAEQRAKLERSGIAHLFDHVEIAREKDVTAYRQLGAQRGFVVGKCWMVGNSPKSDINPSLAAGWNAAFVPHERTWGLEHAEIVTSGPGKLLRLETFADLQRHF